MILNKIKHDFYQPAATKKEQNIFSITKWIQKFAVLMLEDYLIHWKENVYFYGSNDIYLLQEVLCDAKGKNLWKAEWGNKDYLNGNASNRAGVAVLLGENLKQTRTCSLRK